MRRPASITSKAAFPLTGAHQDGRLRATCHPNQKFKGIAFQTCASCHKDPHAAAVRRHVRELPHTTDTWRTTRVDHARTSFPLKGKHQTVRVRARATRSRR